jgi:hypothetical protein
LPAQSDGQREQRDHKESTSTHGGLIGDVSFAGVWPEHPSATTVGSRTKKSKQKVVVVIRLAEAAAGVRIEISDVANRS